MQTQQEQNKKNLIRLSLYQKKQTEQQRRRSALAERVSDYSKIFGLNITQRSVAIKIALKQLEFGDSDESAYNVGANAARTIAMASANEKIRSVKRREIVLH